MQTECNPKAMFFVRLEKPALVADFNGGAMTSDAGALLLGATDRAIGGPLCRLLFGWACPAAH